MGVKQNTNMDCNYKFILNLLVNSNLDIFNLNYNVSTTSTGSGCGGGSGDSARTNRDPFNLSGPLFAPWTCQQIN